MKTLHYARYGNGLKPDRYGQLSLIEEDTFNRWSKLGYEIWEHVTPVKHSQDQVTTKVVEFYL
jgi:hypothetical protein